MRLACVLLLSIAAVPLCTADEVANPVDLAKYQECVTSATKADSVVADLIKACRLPAEAGVPGAQYAFGMGLIGRNEVGDRTAGIEWLEKAAASGNPAATFALGSVLLQEQSPASVERGRALFRQAVCTGYPPAVTALAQGGIARDKIGCRPAADEDFTGEWVADLKWVKSEPVGERGQQLKLRFANDTVQIFMKSDSDWVEVKSGKFRVTHMEQSINVSAMDSGWDFDGKWIESWTIQLLRTAANEASVTFLRTVNNPHIPPVLSWRTFSTVAEGKALRRTP